MDDTLRSYLKKFMEEPYNCTGQETVIVYSSPFSNTRYELPINSFFSTPYDSIGKYGIFSVCYDYTIYGAETVKIVLTGEEVKNE